MHTVIVGAGGIGGYLAAKLVGNGHRVSILARGAHLDAIRKDGLTLSEPEASVTVRPETVTDAPGDIAPADLLVAAVKTQDLTAALTSVAPLVAPGTPVLPFQNGVDAPRLVSEALPNATPLIGVARIFANITAPGVITRYGDMQSFVIGDAAGKQTETAVQDILTAWRGAGIDVPQCADVLGELWSKFLVFNAVSSVTACGRCRMGEVLASEPLFRLAQGLVVETAEVAAAKGVTLPAGAVEQVLGVLRGMVPEARASMAHDIELGKPLEADWICGAVSRFGREVGVPTPLSDACYGILSPWIAGAPKRG